MVFFLVLKSEYLFSWVFLPLLWLGFFSRVFFYYFLFYSFLHALLLLQVFVLFFSGLLWRASRWACLRDGFSFGVIPFPNFIAPVISVVIGSSEFIIRGVIIRSNYCIFLIFIFYTFSYKSNKSFQNLPCFILLSVFDSFLEFEKLTSFKQFQILSKISSTDNQNSHKEEARGTGICSIWEAEIIFS